MIIGRDMARTIQWCSPGHLKFFVACESNAHGVDGNDMNTFAQTKSGGTIPAKQWRPKQLWRVHQWQRRVVIAITTITTILSGRSGKGGVACRRWALVEGSVWKNLLCTSFITSFRTKFLNNHVCTCSRKSLSTICFGNKKMSQCIFHSRTEGVISFLRPHENHLTISAI